MTVIADAPGWLQALILGLVQGLTEFIPVSSSGHLVLVPALAGWERHGLAFDVSLHLGTLFALVVYYRLELWGMLRALLSRTPSPERDGYRRLVWLLALASLPVAVVGLGLGDVVESAVSAPQTAAWLLLGTVAVLVGGEWVYRRRGIATLTGSPPSSLASTSTDASSGPAGAGPVSADPAVAGPAPGRRGVGQVLFVGAMQCFALLPGLSRSGLTISAGIAAGLSRPAATRFAFLLGLPAIAGAAIVQVPQVDDLGTVSNLELAIGVATAAVSGYAAIALLVRLVGRVGIDRFAWYVGAVAVVSLLLLR